jgi:hypothetical protein
VVPSLVTLYRSLETLLLTSDQVVPSKRRIWPAGPTAIARLVLCAHRL